MDHYVLPKLVASTFHFHQRFHPADQIAAKSRNVDEKSIEAKDTREKLNMRWVAVRIFVDIDSNRKKDVF